MNDIKPGAKKLKIKRKYHLEKAGIFIEKRTYKKYIKSEK